MAIPIWLKEKLFQKDLLLKEFRRYDNAVDWQNKLLFAEHHQSHAAERILSITVFRRCRADHGRGWGMGNHIGSDRFW